MKKLESLKNTALKGNVVTENHLRNICGGSYKTYVGAKGDVVSDSGKTYWGGGTVSYDTANSN